MALATIETSSLAELHMSSDAAAAAMALDDIDAVLLRHMSILDQSAAAAAAAAAADKERATDYHLAIVDADAAYCC